jgi:hypothetical protein
LPTPHLPGEIVVIASSQELASTSTVSAREPVAVIAGSQEPDQVDTVTSDSPVVTPAGFEEPTPVAIPEPTEVGEVAAISHSTPAVPQGLAPSSSTVASLGSELTSEHQVGTSSAAPSSSTPALQRGLRPEHPYYRYLLVFSIPDYRPTLQVHFCLDILSRRVQAATKTLLVQTNSSLQFQQLRYYPQLPLQALPFATSLQNKTSTLFQLPLCKHPKKTQVAHLAVV